MASVQDVLNEARKWIGTVENPYGSNNCIFNSWFYGHDVYGDKYPWCCAFVNYVFTFAGAANLFNGGEKTAYCPTLLQYYINHQQIVSSPKPGDIAFFSFGHAVVSHVGIVESVNGDTVITIEGNTSASSNDNGGAVQRRNRKLSSCTAFARPKYDDDLRYVTTERIDNTGIVTASKLNIRSVYSTSGDIYGVYCRGDSVHLIEKSSNNWYKTDKGWISGEYVVLDSSASKYQRGIDLSSNQVGINYQQLKDDGVQFAWLRIIMKNQTKDSMFETHYSGFSSVGIPVSVVWDYTYAITVEQARQEAKNIISYLNGRTPVVCLDVEDKSIANMGEKLIDIINAFHYEVEKAGLRFIGYSGEYYFNTQIRPYIHKLNCKYWWIAAYRLGDTLMSIHDGLGSLQMPNVGSDVHLVAWQYTSHGKVNGYGSYLDMNELYIDLSSIPMGTAKDIDVPIKPSHQVDPNLHINTNSTGNPNNQNFKQYPLIKKGATGIWVGLLQQGLVMRGYKLIINNTFDNATYNAVVDYQTRKNILVDGEVGTQTWTAIFG